MVSQGASGASRTCEPYRILLGDSILAFGTDSSLYPARNKVRCPTLSELPPPPAGRKGWPWTEETPSLPELTSNGKPWPRVSIVTPSYNQGQFLEETIRSVLLQEYPNLEYIIIDGGSTDGSIDIIRKYGKWLHYWVSEPDQGQVCAIQKGWARSSGVALAYLNSDDTYLPNAIAHAVQALSVNPTVAAVCGGELRIDSEGMVIAERLVRSTSLYDLLTLNFIPQPAVFLHRSAYEKAGGIDLTFQLVFDFELWTRLVRFGGIQCIPNILATTRWHSGSKTLSQRPAVISELKHAIQKVLSDSLGKQISRREQRFIQAKLGYLAAKVFLEDASRHRGAILSNSLTAIANWPFIAPSLMRLVFLQMAPRSIVSFARRLKGRIAGREPSNMDRLRKIHWSEWQSGSHGLLNKGR